MLIAFLCFVSLACTSQQKEKNMKGSGTKVEECSVETGVCSPTANNGIEEIVVDHVQKVKLIYYTDPICSACWAIEPELKRFKLEYGQYVDIEYRMGGLLPGWEGFADKANGISKPSDVAHHWEEVGERSGMSIDGDVWLVDPLNSSFPPSIAYKAVQMQSQEKALQFLRRVREMVFLEKKNITKNEHLYQAVEEVGGNVEQFKKDYHSAKAKEAFMIEMNEGRKMGVRGFPTFVFLNQSGTGFKMSGMSGYPNYELALEKALGEKVQPNVVELDEYGLLKKFDYLATREIAFTLNKLNHSVVSKLEELVEDGKVEKVKQKHGYFWRLKD